MPKKGQLGHGNQKAYDHFRELMEHRDFRKAYDVFHRRPGMTNHMRLDEIPRHYKSIQDNLGKEKADIFKIGVRGAFKRADEDCK